MTSGNPGALIWLLICDTKKLKIHKWSTENYGTLLLVQLAQDWTSGELMNILDYLTVPILT